MIENYDEIHSYFIKLILGYFITFYKKTKPHHNFTLELLFFYIKSQNDSMFIEIKFQNQLFSLSKYLFIIFLI